MDVLSLLQSNMDEQNCKEEILSSHDLRKTIESDPYRPQYHFTVPFDLGFPCDPNAPFYYQGKYHLFYIYESRMDSYRWGHVESLDLLHWHHLPDAIIPDAEDGGIYSGGVILEDNVATIIYWALGKDNKPDRIRLAQSTGPDFIHWTKMKNPVVMNTELGITKVQFEEKQIEIGSADPSNIWKNNNKYYVQLGNLCLLNKYRDRVLKKDQEVEQFAGDHAYLFESMDLIHWNYVHEFYQRKKENIFTTIEDDCMCPYFGQLPNGYDHKTLSNKYIELFLSHNRGVQYYLGDYDKTHNQMILDSFGKMSFVDNSLFAPEAILSSDNRLISFFWQRDNQDDDLKRELQKGWSGIHSLPRELFLNEENTLGIAPLRELKQLRYHKVEANFTNTFTKKDFNTDCCEIIIENIKKEKTGKVGIHLGFTNQAFVEIYLDFDSQQLVMDLTKSDSLGRIVCDKSPLKLEEMQTLDIFIDHSMLEVFANQSQAMSRQVFEKEPNQRTITFVHESKNDAKITIYEMMPTN